MVFYRVAQYRYDLQGNKTLERYGKEEVPEGAQPFSYDEVSFAYDADDCLVLVKDGYGASLRYRYDCLGNPVYEERAVEGDIYQRYYYKYNKSGWLIEKKEEVMGNRDCQWAVTSYGYDGDGNLCKTTTLNGHLILRGYDRCDRLVKERTIDKANGIDRTISYTYDKAGNLVSEGESAPGQEGTRIRYTYDWKDRLTHKEDACGGVSHYVYDKNDRIKKQIQPEAYEKDRDGAAGMVYRYDSRGNLTTVDNGLGQRVQENVYNLNNQVVRRKDGIGHHLYLEYTTDLQIM